MTTEREDEALEAKEREIKVRMVGGRDASSHQHLQRGNPRSLLPGMNGERLQRRRRRHLWTRTMLQRFGTLLHKHDAPLHVLLLFSTLLHPSNPSDCAAFMLSAKGTPSAALLHSLPPFRLVLLVVNVCPCRVNKMFTTQFGFFCS